MMKKGFIKKPFGVLPRHTLRDEPFESVEDDGNAFVATELGLVGKDPLDTLIAAEEGDLETVLIGLEYTGDLLSQPLVVASPTARCTEGSPDGCEGDTGRYDDTPKPPLRVRNAVYFKVVGDKELHRYDFMKNSADRDPGYKRRNGRNRTKGKEAA